MTREFAMMQATRQLEGYLSKERYNLGRMVDNDNVTDSFLDVKVEHYNGLVTAVNGLFALLSGTPEPLFEHFRTDSDDDSLVIELPSYVTDAIPTAQPVLTAPAETFAESMTVLGVAERTPEPEPASSEPEIQVEAQEEQVDEVIPEIWESDGYSSYEDWLADKEAESQVVETSVDVGLSQYRVEKILAEYSATTEQDIDSYVPEDDAPASVFPGEVHDEDVDHDEDEDENELGENGHAEELIESTHGYDDYVPGRDLSYLNHTADNTRLDTDPTQITLVETAVEREGINGSRSAEIDVLDFAYQSVESMVGNLIDEDIDKLRKQPVPEHAADD